MWTTPAEQGCGEGTTTRVSVVQGMAVVRHAGRDDELIAGAEWPSGCSRAPAASGPVATLPPAGASGARVAAAPSASSTLADQNNLFAVAVAARRRGDAAGAVAGFDRFLARYPASPLAESATVERMRALRTSDPARAVAAARQYLATYPSGFAHAEAEAIVAGTP